MVRDEYGRPVTPAAVDEDLEYLMSGAEENVTLGFLLARPVNPQRHPKAPRRICFTYIRDSNGTRWGHKRLCFLPLLLFRCHEFLLLLKLLLLLLLPLLLLLLLLHSVLQGTEVRIVGSLLQFSPICF